MSVASVYGSPSRVMADREEEKLLLQALRQIPLDLQTIVELHYWEQLPVGEIAAILEVPAGTVKSRLFRARDALREQLGAMDIPAPCACRRETGRSSSGCVGTSRGRRSP